MECQEMKQLECDTKLAEKVDEVGERIGGKVEAAVARFSSRRCASLVSQSRMRLTRLSRGGISASPLYAGRTSMSRP